MTDWKQKSRDLSHRAHMGRLYHCALCKKPGGTLINADMTIEEYDPNPRRFKVHKECLVGTP